MDLFKRWAINLTEQKVALIDGEILIRVKGWAGLTEEEYKHKDVISAVRRKWIKIANKEPAGPAEPEEVKPNIIVVATKKMDAIKVGTK